MKFVPEKTNGVVYIRHGNLKSEEEAKLVLEFVKKYMPENIRPFVVNIYEKWQEVRKS